MSQDEVCSEREERRPGPWGPVLEKIVYLRRFEYFCDGAAIVFQFGIYRQRRLLAGVTEGSSSFSICTNIVTGRSFS